jgi:hypothetical protein
VRPPYEFSDTPPAVPRLRPHASPKFGIMATKGGMENGKFQGARPGGPGVDVMAKGPQGWVQCEVHRPCYKDSSCSLLPLLLSMIPWSLQSSNNRGGPKFSLW